jgi:hypothetical protein
MLISSHSFPSYRNVAFLFPSYLLAFVHVASQHWLNSVCKWFLQIQSFCRSHWVRRIETRRTPHMPMCVCVSCYVTILQDSKSSKWIHTGAAAELWHTYCIHRRVRVNPGCVRCGCQRKLEVCKICVQDCQKLGQHPLDPRKNTKICPFVSDRVSSLEASSNADMCSAMTNAGANWCSSSNDACYAGFNYQVNTPLDGMTSFFQSLHAVQLALRGLMSSSRSQAHHCHHSIWCDSNHFNMCTECRKMWQCRQLLERTTWALLLRMGGRVYVHATVEALKQGMLPGGVCSGTSILFCFALSRSQQYILRARYDACVFVQDTGGSYAWLVCVSWICTLRLPLWL